MAGRGKEPSPASARGGDFFGCATDRRVGPRPLAVRSRSCREYQKRGSRGMHYGFHRVAKAWMGC